jgi:hypothetical protein
MKKSTKKLKPMMPGSGSQFIVKKGGSTKKPMMKKGGMMKRGC